MHVQLNSFTDTIINCTSTRTHRHTKETHSISQKMHLHPCTRTHSPHRAPAAALRSTPPQRARQRVILREPSSRAKRLAAVCTERQDGPNPTVVAIRRVMEMVMMMVMMMASTPLTFHIARAAKAALQMSSAG